MSPRRANRSDDVLVVVDRLRLVFCRRDRGVMNQRSLRWNRREGDLWINPAAHHGFKRQRVRKRECFSRLRAFHSLKLYIRRNDLVNADVASDRIG
jgi:hypothetical protein